MQHFIRQIRRKIIEKKQLRKYLLYAAGEIALVVIGILIALQINNWNEARKADNRGEAYMERLAENLREDQQKLTYRIAFYHQVEDFGERVLQYHDDPQAIPRSAEWDILVSFFQASQIWPFIPTSTTYEELKSEGELSLIPRVDLRSQLDWYYRELMIQYNQTIGIIPEYRGLIRGLIPLHIQDYMWDTCHEDNESIQQLVGCPSPDNYQEVGDVVRSLYNNPRVIQTLRSWMSNIKAGDSIMQHQKEQTALLLESIYMDMQ